MKLDLQKEDRMMVTNIGPKHPTLNKLINLELPGNSLFFYALKKLKEAFLGIRKK